MLDISDSKKEKEAILVSENSIEQMESDDFEEKEDNNTIDYTCKEKMIYILKGISSIISCIFHTFRNYSIWMLGYTNIYLISFRRHYNKNIDFSYTYYYMPLLHLSFSLSAPISGIIENKYGDRLIIFISNLILCTSFFAMYYSRSIYIDYILILLIGLGIAIGYNITKKNACSFFVRKKVFIIGFINLICNLLCFVLLFYNECDILNYESRPPSIDYTYYRKRIFMNYQNLIIFEIKLLTITCLGTLSLYFKNDPKETLKFGFNEKKIIDNNKERIETIEKKKKKISKSLDLKNAIKSKRTLRLIIMVFLFFPTIIFINNNMRMEITLYFFFGIIYNIIGSISFLLFMIFGNCIQFRILFIILSALISMGAFMFTLGIDDNGLFLPIGIAVSSFVFSGFEVIYDAHIMNVYGMKKYSQISGIIRAFSGISGIMVLIFNSIFDKKSTIYGTIGCFNLFSLYFAFFENDEKFKYDK